MCRNGSCVWSVWPISVAAGIGGAATAHRACLLQSGLFQPLVSFRAPASLRETTIAAACQPSSGQIRYLYKRIKFGYAQTNYIQPLTVDGPSRGACGTTGGTARASAARRIKYAN